MVKKSVSKKEDDSKLFAFLAVFLSIIGFVIAIVAKKDNKYVMFYAKQSLVLFIGIVIVSITKIIPIIGDVIYVVGTIIVIILWITQILNSLSGKEKETLFIGSYVNNINL
ncbi:MAG: hypothetical protein AABW81_01995 [Nanoarchaeota archaeon]